MAISIIALLLPSAILFINTIRTMNARANTMSIISAYVENKIEAYRSAGFNGVPLTSGPQTYTGAEDLPASIPKPRSATYDVQLVDAGNPALKKITITVTYHTAGGSQTLTYITYLGELGVGQY